MKPLTDSDQSRRADLASRLPSLIQQDIIIRCSEDNVGDVYTARVLVVDGKRLRISLPRRITGHGYLRSSCPVSLIFVLGKQLYNCPADYLADEQRTRELVVNGEIKRTTRRDYLRHSVKIHAVYVPVSNFSLARGQFASIQWKKSMTLDLSGGGVLLQIALQAPVDSYLLLKLGIPAFGEPFFVFGQVRWSGLSDARGKLFLCGVRFIRSEELPDHFSKRSLSDLPEKMLQFDKNLQKKLEAHLKTASGHRNQGDDNDDKQNCR